MPCYVDALESCLFKENSGSHLYAFVVKHFETFRQRDDVLLSLWPGRLLVEVVWLLEKCQAPAVLHGRVDQEFFGMRNLLLWPKSSIYAVHRRSASNLSLGFLRLFMCGAVLFGIGGGPASCACLFLPPCHGRFKFDANCWHLCYLNITSWNEGLFPPKADLVCNFFEWSLDSLNKIFLRKQDYIKKKSNLASIYKQKVLPTFRMQPMLLQWAMPSKWAGVRGKQGLTTVWKFPHSMRMQTCAFNIWTFFTNGTCSFPRQFFMQWGRLSSVTTRVQQLIVMLRL